MIDYDFSNTDESGCLAFIPALALLCLITFLLFYYKPTTSPEIREMTLPDGQEVWVIGNGRAVQIVPKDKK